MRVYVCVNAYACRLFENVDIRGASILDEKGSFLKLRTKY